MFRTSVCSKPLEKNDFSRGDDERVLGFTLLSNARLKNVNPRENVMKVACDWEKRKINISICYKQRFFGERRGHHVEAQGYCFPSRFGPFYSAWREFLTGGHAPVLEFRESRGHMPQIALPNSRESIRCRRLAKANFTDDANNHERMLFFYRALCDQKNKSTFSDRVIDQSVLRLLLCIYFAEAKIRNISRN